jgi:hypothetical protein
MATAPASAQARLLDLQACDTRLAQISHARAGIEQRPMLREVEQQLSVTGDREVAARTEASDIAREQSRAETDVEGVRARIERDQQLMDAGGIPAKELESLAHEIESLRRRQSELEDVELEIMERLEGAQSAARQYQGEIAELTAQRDELLAQIASREAELASEEGGIQAERGILIAELPQDLLALYDRIRGDSGAVGAALLQHGACQGCRISLPASELNRLRAAGDDAVERCDNCRCILVRTHESGL